MKIFITLALLLSTTLTYGQKSTLIHNINVRANELKHSLNKTGDSIILDSERSIYKVTIFNSDFEISFDIKDKNAKIPLYDIPVGRYVTEVKLSGKLIIITLIRHDKLKRPVIIKEQNYEIPLSPVAQARTQANETSLLGKTPLLTNETLKKPLKVVKFYWIVNKINKGFNSRKLMKIGDREAVEKMIHQNNIDLTTTTGKHNTLTIWEVYDTSKFMRYKRKHPDYANAENVDCFNSAPYFSTKIEE